MPNPAAGLFKQLAYKAEATFGTIPAAAGAQFLRRTSSTIDLNKDTYESNELRPDFQRADFRHGVRRVAGQIQGELSPKTYSDFFAAALKRAFAAVTAITGASITIAGSGPTYTVTRAAGSFLTDGFKIGDVIRLSVGTFNVANANRNLFIVGLTATVATVLPFNAGAMVAEGPIATSTVTVIGKKTFVPTSGHTDSSFSFEHFYSDLTQSEVFSGCKIDKMSLSLPPSGLATVNMDVIGQNVTTASARYFTSPTAVTTYAALAAVNGVIQVGGATVANLTGLTMEIDPTFAGDPVVGSNQVPFLFPGRVLVTGQATAYFDSTTMRDIFLNETETSLIAAFTTDNTNTADFISLALPRVKFGGAAKNDGDGGLVQTIPFTALFNSAGGAGISTEQTTISVQDSQA
jgi:hypothetical protein